MGFGNFRWTLHFLPIIKNIIPIVAVPNNWATTNDGEIPEKLVNIEIIDVIVIPTGKEAPRISRPPRPMMHLSSW